MRAENSDRRLRAVLGAANVRRISGTFQRREQNSKDKVIKREVRSLDARNAKKNQSSHFVYYHLRYTMNTSMKSVKKERKKREVDKSPQIPSRLNLIGRVILSS